MAQKTINTVIVLRNDQTTNWESSDYKLLPGEVGIGYLTKTVDGQEVTNVIAKLGTDGKTAWKDLPQVEGVFEDEITLTHDFGRYKTSNGYVRTTDATGMTTSQWLIHALSETKNPTVTDPTFTLTASAVGAGGEIGSYITGLKWDGTTTYGSYEYGPSTGLSASNRTWAISNNINTDTASTEDGTFTLGESDKIRLTQETSKVYAKVTGTYSLDATNAAVPLNNVGAPYAAGKITSKSGTIEAEVKASAYRKPFYGVLTPDKVVNTSALTSAAIRSLPSSGSATKGLPSSISVPAGSQMVIFAAKADTYKSLTATDDKAMNATVSFEKVAKAVKVEGAGGFEAVDYDVWYVNWGAGIGSAKQLTLKWA